MADEPHTPENDAAEDAQQAEPSSSPPDNGISQDELDALMDRVQEEVTSDAAEFRADGAPPDSAAAPASRNEQPAVVGFGADTADPAAAEPLEIRGLAETSGAKPLSTIDLLDDVELDVKIELGRTRMYIEDVLRLGVGSVVELDKLAGDPVDIYVNERVVAHGEVLVLNDNFCVRINDVISSTTETEDCE